MAIRLDSQDIASLHERGFTLIPRVLDAAACADITRSYDDAARFRSRVIMSRHGFGRGEYQYYAYPLPARIDEMRESLYAGLVPIADQWQEQMGSDIRYPESHAAFLARCRAAGQTRPTPLLLRYEAGDFNCLHQDLYGEHVFPLQMAVLLSCPGEDFTGGEFVLTEHRPRQQSRVEVVPLKQGDAVVFAVNERPMRSSRGFHRVKMRHGVSRVISGRRHTLGIILHDAA